ncbi:MULTISPECIES: histidine phosphatase family protein [unclassified Halomonas]|uniref:histidine phosphatase family protein n=1 Tax=unclassified Halomonas TaxID=2609666 RepID=UPI0007D9FBBF|nr:MULTISPECIES: histidine phosphatase family protein [unclassified Halomonas]MBT2788456.1 histidine phosphatase family protein [Halomonas sp. ISL-106]MBT2798047.1 histidine phosphatase family protein [Halomonas sp. ISL-104]OAL60613.1 phosphoglycerate mutase [Halomonas sp. ALS9]
MATDLNVELVAVRHGITAWNLERRYQGQQDIPLLFPDAETGLLALRDALFDERLDAIYSSDLQRCQQTLEWAQAAKEGLPVMLEPRLRELDFGEYEGKVYDELKDLPHYRAWIDSVGELQIPSGESAAQLRKRLDAWLDNVAINAQEGGHKKILVVTHGGVIRELRRRFETIHFWDGTVAQAQGRRWQLIYKQNEQGKEEWQCSSSSAVPALESATP